MTGSLAQINLQGPRSRELLSRLTSADVSDAAFPFRACRRLDVGCATLLATRITYVGELGYELFVPSESALHVYDAIVAAGEPLGLVHAGLKALGSLRLLGNPTWLLRSAATGGRATGTDATGTDATGVDATGADATGADARRAG